MSSAERWFILAAQCPKCGWRPGKRITETHRLSVMGVDPGEILDSMKCQRKGCETTYIIPARAYHNARAA